MRHVLLRVIERRYDPFWKIRSHLRDCNVDLIEIELSESSLQKILDVEYSNRKMFRFLYYRSVFSEIERAIVDSCSSYDGVVRIYLTDEGVWSEMIKHIVKKNIQPSNIQFIMVQHGLFNLEANVKSQRIRKLLNSLSIWTVGFPSWGYGNFGSKLDCYLVYSEEDKAYIEKQSDSVVFVCAQLIKADLIKEYYDTEENRANDSTKQPQRTVLFAMQPIVPGCGIECTEMELYEGIANFVAQLKQHTAYPLVLRPHPGSDRKSVLEMIASLSYSDLVEIDDSQSLNEALLQADFVLSVHSTALFDASLFGKVPVQLIGEFYERELHIEHELIDLRQLTPGLVKRIFSGATIESYSTFQTSQDEVEALDFLTSPLR